MKRELVDKNELLNKILDYSEEDEDTETDYVLTDVVVSFFNHAEVVEERKHSEWIPCMKDNRGCTEMFKCSECKRYSYYAYGVKRLDYKYCPHCGALMDEERKDKCENT